MLEDLTSLVDYKMLRKRPCAALFSPLESRLLLFFSVSVL